VVASYWAKLSEPLLRLPRFGAINIHPSLLPRYRGAAPIQHALLRGDTVTGVTIFSISSKMDAGDILGQVSVPVEEDDDSLTLHDRLAREAVPLLLKVLDALENGRASPRSQDESQVIRAPKLSKKDGAIPWRQSAEAIQRRIRALISWPGAFTYYPTPAALIRIIITRSQVIQEEACFGRAHPGCIVQNEPRLVVACGEGFLEILQLKREGKKDLSAEAFLRGMKLTTGSAFVTPDSVEGKK
jgi:methionyl-tRNA formyltransferase